jgi:hypothetical protein
MTDETTQVGAGPIVLAVDLPEPSEDAARTIKGLQAEVAEYQAMFDLAWQRFIEANDLWRTERPGERELQMADSGVLMEWLIERGNSALAQLAAARNVLDQVTGERDEARQTASRLLTDRERNYHLAADCPLDGEGRLAELHETYEAEVARLNQQVEEMGRALDREHAVQHRLRAEALRLTADADRYAARLAEYATQDRLKIVEGVLAQHSGVGLHSTPTDGLRLECGVCGGMFNHEEWRGHLAKAILAALARHEAETADRNV